ncbi:MAG: amylo-alpha-1,6-glucosidase [Desulfococcaceae bacterium]
MTTTPELRQIPEPGRRLVRFRGDTVAFTLIQRRPAPGRAWLRTNIGRAAIARREIIDEVDSDAAPLGRDWFDLPMDRTDEDRFSLVLPLAEVGHFQAKALFLPEGERDPLWPEGGNTALNVAPAHTVCGNTIYNAFVRQFGPNKDGGGKPDPVQGECIRNLDDAGYTVIPRSGTFRDLIRHLDFIVGELGCRFLQLLPVHPTPTTYGRMGRFGSPYAALSFTEVDPALAEFDPKATPLEQFLELVDAVHARNARMILDIAINHTGWAASLHESHPEWLARDESGHIITPGAWGVVWEDLTKLDFGHRGLWSYMAEVFLAWCRRGADGFRCDAGYMIPLAAWRYIVARVRTEYPDTLFLLEGLGGKISVTRELLNSGNLDWAYSELFQNYNRDQIEAYLPGAMEIADTDGLTVHFAETHDNNRLAAVSRLWARMRTALCALCAPNGAFGFANGVEWFAAEKIQVHEANSLNWGAHENQVAHIRRLTALLERHPCFQDGTDLWLAQTGPGNGIVLIRHHRPSGRRLVVLVNLDAEAPARLAWRSDRDGNPPVVDLLSGDRVAVSAAESGWSCDLEPGQARCLSWDAADLKLTEPERDGESAPAPSRQIHQRLRAAVLDLMAAAGGGLGPGEIEVDALVHELAENPRALAARLNPRGDHAPLVRWTWARDLRRVVSVPPGYLLLVEGPRPFRARIFDGDRCRAAGESLPKKDGAGHFALLGPLPTPDEDWDLNLRISVFHDGRAAERREAPLRFLADPDRARARLRFGRAELLDTDLRLLATNGRGGMLRASVHWGRLNSRYDALLAANLDPEVPEDRWMFLARCRAWVVYQGFSQELRTDCLEDFQATPDGRGRWRFHVPTGQGGDLFLTASVQMIEDANRIRMAFFRHRDGTEGRGLDDDRPVKLILRPDIEDRSFHETVKAFAGPEHAWPGAVTPAHDGFVFRPAPDRAFHLRLSGGAFTSEPEWHYMVHRPADAERALDPDSDLFSPGYLTVFLSGGETAVLDAWAGEDGDEPEIDAPTELGPSPTEISLDEALVRALDAYVVRRETGRTVIAGYPWFLDWGRDTLIVVRGLIAAGRRDAARQILKQFARFEESGTLPNMIRGNDARDRDTSDAPLWFAVACADWIETEEKAAFLEESVDGRTIRDVLISIGRGYRDGTSNGIRMDPETGLIFSPAHFTWMDTNFPAGTPRQGYPVEIQALWHAAVRLLSRIDSDHSDDWDHLGERVRSALAERFFSTERGFLSDCLHAGPGQSAVEATPDDALRPNQLYALTLGAVTDPAMARSILDACEELLVPGAIRSLADRPVSVPLEVRRDGELLNDPRHPYAGRYTGDEDTRRKPAYHNGTAWTWVFPAFSEAYATVYGDGGRPAARAWLAGAARLLNTGVVMHLPEILDGDAPHAAKGCDAQAWGASELVRVWRMLSPKRQRESARK